MVSFPAKFSDLEEGKKLSTKVEQPSAPDWFEEIVRDGIEMLKPVPKC